MTKKDYLKAVSIIKFSNVRNNTERQLLAETFADFFAQDNSRFDRDRFLEAVFSEKK